MKIIRENETINDIKPNLYKTQDWADVFWMRRKNHSKRTDPEIPFVFKNKPKIVLEIGSAYGRILKKLSDYIDDKSLNVSLFGIDICHHFKDYSEIYSKKFSSNKLPLIIYENFFNSFSLHNFKFDIILLPMNTFPSFSVKQLKTLFSTVKSYLNEDGQFIFSTHKSIVESNEKRLKNILSPQYGGEFLVEQGSDRILNEYYEFGAHKTEFGYQIVSYKIFTRLDPNYFVKTRNIYRGNLEIYYSDKLTEIINGNGFNVDFTDDTSHSMIYCTSIMN